MKIFSDKLYGQIIKKERLDQELTLLSLNELIGIDLAAISRLETGSQLPIEKYELLFDYFNIDKDFIDKAENELSSAFIQFMQAIIDISPDVEKYYLDLQTDFEEYRNSIFSFVFDLSNFIYSYFKRNYVILEFQTILDCIDFLSDEYQSYAYIYIAQYLESCKNMKEAKLYFEKAEHKIKKNEQLEAFYYYTISRFFLHNNEIIEAINYTEKATSLFLKLQNYNRLININIQKGKQYRFLHIYESALQIDLKTMNHVKDNEYLELEKNVIINNIAWTYLLMDNYQAALEYIEKIPTGKKNYNHFFDESVCYIMLKENDTALKICNCGLVESSGTDRDFAFLEWLRDYLQNEKNNQILTRYKKIYKQYKYQLSNIDCEYYLKLLMHFYIEQKSYKNATNVALEILSLKNN